MAGDEDFGGHSMTKVRAADRWFSRQPLWRYILIWFFVNSLIWSFVPYAAAWQSGGSTNGDFGFDQDGHLSISFVLMSASIVTVIVAIGEVRRRRRAATRRDT
jgi:hypothetical protein